jgi:F0F1-type ATP synthase assembly protein I
MSIITRKRNHATSNSFHLIIMLSAWGFAMGLASLLFLWLGQLLDEMLGTAPIFMLSLFLLAVIGSFIEIYQEASKMIKDA